MYTFHDLILSSIQTHRNTSQFLSVNIKQEQRNASVWDLISETSLRFYNIIQCTNVGISLEFPDWETKTFSQGTPNFCVCVSHKVSHLMWLYTRHNFRFYWFFLISAHILVSWLKNTALFNPIAHLFVLLRSQLLFLTST
jgi:hypothetical protein